MPGIAVHDDPPEVRRLRSLLDRFIAANEKYMRATLRLIYLPYDGPNSPQLDGKRPTIKIAVPGGDEEPRDAHVVRPPAMRDSMEYDFWGMAAADKFDEPEQLRRLVILAWEGPDADLAASEFEQLAAESGRLYQALPPRDAPVHTTTSPRNLWATLLFAWLGGTAHVFEAEGLEVVGLPFAASAELWRRFCYGTTADRKVTPGEIPLTLADPSEEPGRPKAKSNKSLAPAAAEKQSWTQRDLNAAIRKYKADRASTYNDLVEGVRAGRPGAKKAAEKMFGRNAVARKLGVKSRTMVSKSPEWQQIAEELRLPHGKRTPMAARQKVGFDAAIDEHSAEGSESPHDIAIRNETIRLIRERLPQESAEATVEKLYRGEITDDDARHLVEVVKEQDRDRRIRKIRRAP